jgi:hypothetical protein
VSAEGYVGVIVTICVTSRLQRFLLVKSSASSYGVEALREWRRWVGRTPVSVDVDGGPSFKGIYIDYLAKFGINLHRGTAHNHEGRGLAERAIRTLKHAIRCILPQGRLRE